MPFTLIKGSFHVVSYSPDGDSIRFRPDDPELLVGLSGARARGNARGHFQLRIEGIDTLETHYAPGSGLGVINQPLQYAYEAIELLFGYLGISNVKWDSKRLNVLDANDNQRGYVLSRNVEKNGRPVAFVFAGNVEETDGEKVFLDVPRLKLSYNYLVLQRGLAYATYYRGLFSDLREAMTDQIRQVRENGLGLYAEDRTGSGFEADGLESIVETNIILPKLFRRLSEYIGFNGTALGFKEKLSESMEPVLDLRSSNFTHFDTFVEQEAGSLRISLSRLPEELVFDEMLNRPANAFTSLLREGS